MSSAQSLREFIRERLTDAAAEIFSEFEQTIVRYEEEIDRQRRLLEISWKPQINLHRIELPLHDVSKDEEVLTDQQLWNQERTSSLDQEQPEPPQMKVEQDESEPLQVLEQEELCMSQDEEQLVLKQETVTSLVTPADEDRDHHGPEPDRHQLLLSLLPEAETRAAPPGSTDAQQVVLIKEETHEEQGAGVDQQDPEHLHIKEEQEELWTSLEETDGDRFPFTAVSIKSEDDTEKPLFTQLHHQQIEDRNVPTSSSADQMPSDCGGGAETSRNPDLNPHQKTSDSSETEVSGDDDVNLDSELSESGSETGDGDNDWNESRSSESPINKSFSCPECGENFFHKQSLQKHVQVTSHSATKSSSCLVNKKCVEVKKNLDSYKKVQKEQKFNCDDCGKQFSRISNLNIHLRVHTGQKPFFCELCEQRFSSKTNLNRHMRVHTGQKPLACVLCEQRFRDKCALKSHMNVHTGQKPFFCELCGQRFSRKTNLNSHIKVHTGQKPFACELCGRRFSRKTNLNNHMNVHTGQKPFACEFCGQRFRDKCALKSHMNVHTGQTPFFCELCGQRFSRKRNLNSHIKVHTGQKPFACELCGQRFSRKTNLNHHMNVHTG
ncbi:zinc finger protein 260 isoform X2 [Nothobranchius furzeri]|uniref:zinc finger protein 260 isoform X2 n=1 Tax=Nothobranchius furzeri TaxID=105023 RepID=UPI0039049543